MCQALFQVLRLSSKQNKIPALGSVHSSQKRPDAKEMKKEVCIGQMVMMTGVRSSGERRIRRTCGALHYIWRCRKASRTRGYLSICLGPVGISGKEHCREREHWARSSSGGTYLTGLKSLWKASTMRKGGAGRVWGQRSSRRLARPWVTL